MGQVIAFPRHRLVGRDVPCTHDWRAEGYCPVCQGGLSLCVTCGGAEASLPRQCPGVMMTDLQAESVQLGVADYDLRRGGWYEVVHVRERR